MKKVIVVLAVLGLFSFKYAFHTEAEVTVKNSEQATFGGGCFWCVEAIFEQLDGVSKVESGYSGGKEKNPTYKEISRGLSGHAEVVHITFDPKKVDYNELLDVFFATHDPTTLNRQGADVGPQYRSVILYHNETQKAKALNFIKELEKEKVFDNKIVTEVSKFDKFYIAENYHQDYYRNNKYKNRYCTVVISPKVEKFRKKFKEKLKKDI